MSKKKTGLLIAVSAAIGAVAGISYYLKYKSFSDELDKDFHDYEDEDSSPEKADGNDAADTDASERTYITLDSAKCKPGESEETAKTPEAEASPETLKEADAEETAEAPESVNPQENAEADKAPSAEITVEEDTDGVNG